MNENRVLILANLVGKMALQSGAETYRVEDIINRICRHYGLNAQCFVSITCIITSVRNHKGELFCSVERVPNRTTNLNKVHSINQLVRDIKKYSFDEFAKNVNIIDKEIPYKKYIYFLAYCFGAFSFSLLFKGKFNDACCAFISGHLLVYQQQQKLIFKKPKF